MRLALALLGLAAAASPAAAERWRDGIEKPPLQYASGPTQYGQTGERVFDNLQDLQAFCNFYLGRPPAGAYQACYVPALDLVVLPAKHAWPDPRGRQELREHEWAHARGWRHDTSTTTASTAAGRAAPAGQ